MSFASSHTDSINERLYNIFSKYGVLYGIQVFIGTPDTEKNQAEETVNVANVKSSYAFVNFISTFAAARAKADLAGRLFMKGQLARIKFATRKSIQPAPQPLFITKCYEVANHYLGFNGYQIAILSISTDEEAEQGIIRCVARVKLDIVKHQLSCEGLNVSEQKWPAVTPSEKGEIICRLKKTTFQKACENAFSKMILVVLATGKVHVEINTTYEDTLDDIAEMSNDNFIKVNELDDAPKSDDEGEVDEADDMDEMNRHLLLDLAEEWQ